MKKFQIIETPDGVKITLNDDEKLLKIIETHDYILAVSDEEIKTENCYLYNKLRKDIRKCFSIERNRLVYNEKDTVIISYQPKGNAPELDLPLLPLEGLMKVWKYTHDLSSVKVGMKLHCRNGNEYVVTHIDKDECGRLCYWEDNIEIIKQYTSPHNMLTKKPFVAFEYEYQIVIEDNVERLIEEAYVKHGVKDDMLSLYEQIQRSGGFIVGFKEGHKAATKVYSEEDLRKAMIKARKNQQFPFSFPETDDEIIQSLKQPKTPKWFFA